MYVSVSTSLCVYDEMEGRAADSLLMKRERERKPIKRKEKIESQLTQRRIRTMAMEADGTEEVSFFFHEGRGR